MWRIVKKSNIKKALLILISMILFAYKTGDYRSNYNIPLSVNTIETSDLDLDGQKDLITGHNINYLTKWSGISKLNNNYGNFTLIDSIKVFRSWRSNVLSVNMDSNPLPEIITMYEDTSINNEYVALIFNNSNNISYYSLYTYTGFQLGSTGMLNQDSLMDIIILSYPGKSWGILYNDGTGNLSAPEYFNIDFPPTSIACGNLNDDGKDDVVIGGGDVLIYLSNNTGFDSITINNGSWDVFIDDFDQDGDNDIVGIDGMYTWNYFTYIENTGNNNFIKLPDTTTHPGCLNFFLSDLDNDNFKEILCLDNNLTGVYIFYNKGNFHLSDPVFVPIEYYGEESRDIHCDDIDGNGFNDIIVTRRSGLVLPSNLVVLFNDGNGNFVEDPMTFVQKKSKCLKYTFKCFPNPFVENTIFSFKIFKESHIELTVCNIQGKKIKCLLNNKTKGGNFKIKWDGLDQHGEPCKPGTYIVYLIEDRTVIQTAKIIKIK